MAMPPAGPQHPRDLGESGGRVRDQLQHGERDGGVDRLVAQGKLLRVRPQEADVGARLGLDRAGQHRLGDVDAEREPVGPAAPASCAVTLPGPLPTSRATPPGGMSSQSMGSRHTLASLRASA